MSRARAAPRWPAAEPTALWRRRRCFATIGPPRPQPPKDFQRKSLLRRLATRTAQGTTGCVALTFAAYQTGVLGWLDEGSERSLTFWSAAFPIYLRYEWVQQRNKRGLLGDDEAMMQYDVLHNRYAHYVRDLTYEMRGFYLKNAQLMSTRDEFVPAQYLEWCKDTQDNCPTEFGPGEARVAVEQELGRKVLEVFERWDDEPLAVASIGQVHCARLTSSAMAELAAAGQALDSPEVVVKIQLPNIERRFRSDITTIKRFCALAMPQHVPPMEEIERQFLTEFDYRLEAQNLAEVRANVLGNEALDSHGRPWSERVAIPKPAQALCTKGVLVMERLPGVPMVAGLKQQFGALAKAQGKTLSELEVEQKEAIASGKVQMLSLQQDAEKFAHYNRLLRLKRWGAAPFRLAWNYSIGLIGARWDPPRPMGAGPNGELLSLGEALTTLADVHAHEIFVDGVFNGDPHPGNVMLLPDGRLGLVDYGQVKHINLATRLSYAKVIVALDEQNQEEVARIVQGELGGKSKYMRPDICYRITAFWSDRDTRDITGGRNIAEFMVCCSLLLVSVQCVHL